MKTMKYYSFKNNKSAEEIFKIIRDYHQLSFSHCLKIILKEKKVSIPDLHKRLLSKGYYLSLESLYRYFNPNLSSNRFPSREFVQVFADVIYLHHEQTNLLLKFYFHSKLKRKA